VVHHVSLLDKERFRKALVRERPRSSAAAVVALGLLSKALGALPLLSAALVLVMGLLSISGRFSMQHMGVMP
jgi:hypothetical protein